jgi:hypothetical protein
MTNTTLHDPAGPVYPKLVNGIVHIRVPDSKSKRIPYELSRRGHALLAADVKRGRVDLAEWPVAKLAEALGASKRSTFGALKLTTEERDDVRAGRRPLFQHATASAPITPAEHLRLAVNAIGIDGALAILAAVEVAA